MGKHWIKESPQKDLVPVSKQTFYILTRQKLTWENNRREVFDPSISTNGFKFAVRRGSRGETTCRGNRPLHVAALGRQRRPSSRLLVIPTSTCGMTFCHRTVRRRRRAERNVEKSRTYSPHKKNVLNSALIAIMDQSLISWYYF